MANFSANVQDLDEATAYEVEALDFLRAALTLESEAASTHLSVTLGDVSADGKPRGSIGLHLQDTLSAGAVAAALGRMRPLAFSAAFKVQDMIAEWILRENGSTAWQFKQKLAAYATFSSAGTLIEPPLLSGWPLLSKAFWQSYKFLVPFRGTVVHSSGVSVLQDGTIKIVKAGQILLLSPAQQAAYIRAMCTLVKQLLGLQLPSGPSRQLLENDFATLAALHGQAGFMKRSVRLSSLQIEVPVAAAASTSPFEVEIDFDLFRKTMEEIFPPGPDGILFYSTEIKAKSETRDIRWYFPHEAMQTGKIRLFESTAQVVNLPLVP